MGMHRLFDVDNQPACGNTPSPEVQAELASLTPMNRWFAEQIWGAENLRPVTTKEQK